jgi:hypothetical protein
MSHLKKFLGSSTLKEQSKCRRNTNTTAFLQALKAHFIGKEDERCVVGNHTHTNGDLILSGVVVVESDHICGSFSIFLKAGRNLSMCTTVAEIRSMKKLRFYSYELEENIVK